MGLFDQSSSFWWLWYFGNVNTFLCYDLIVTFFHLKEMFQHFKEKYQKEKIHTQHSMIKYFIFLLQHGSFKNKVYPLQWGSYWNLCKVASNSCGHILFRWFLLLFGAIQLHTVTQHGNNTVPVFMDWLVPGALVCIYTESFSGYGDRGNLLCIFIKLFVIIVV